MPGLEKYTVVAEVTSKQYDALVSNSVSCQLIANIQILDVRDISSVSSIVQAVLLHACEGDDNHSDAWPDAESLDHGQIEAYDAAASHWPVHVLADLIVRAESFIEVHVETGAGYEVYSSLEPDDEDVRAILDAYPPLYGMFSTSPDEVATWFR